MSGLRTTNFSSGQAIVYMHELYRLLSTEASSAEERGFFGRQALTILGGVQAVGRGATRLATPAGAASTIVAVAQSDRAAENVRRLFELLGLG